MAHATPDAGPGVAQELSIRTLPTFFRVMEVLLRAGVTTVAEAAFQDRLWRPGLGPLRGLARIRIVHCTVDAETAFTRSLRRSEKNPLRRAHTNPGPGDVPDYIRRLRAFDRVSVDAPWIEVDTTSGYRPELGQVVEFINGPTADETRANLQPAGDDAEA